jgi:hypothetical protein
MEVEVLVGIYVVEGETGFPICTKLSFDFRSQLHSDRGPRAYLKSESREVLPQISAGVNEIG